MNKVLYTVVLGLALVSCGGAGDATGGKKFNPGKTVSETAMTDSERQSAIDAKRNSLNTTNIDLQQNYNGLRFCVLPPAVNADITPALSEKIALKLTEISAQNGVGGISYSPVLATVVQVNRTESAMTNTAPQKFIVKYDVTIYCGNFASNELYASSTLSLSGVASSEELAVSQAFDGLKNSPELKAMFSRASENALAWYNNESAVRLVVDNAVAERNFALAMAVLSSVPSYSTSFEYAEKRNQEVCDLMFKAKAAGLLASMKDAIVASDGAYSPKVGAYFRLIPETSEVYEEAVALFSEYAERVAVTSKDNLERARALEDREAADTMKMRMERMEIAKIKAPYEAKAVLAKIEADSKKAIAQVQAEAKVGVAEANAKGKANANTGGFLGLGKLWDGSFNLLNRLLDSAEN